MPARSAASSAVPAIIAMVLRIIESSLQATFF
jgi:hypothetical protein